MGWAGNSLWDPCSKGSSHLPSSTPLRKGLCSLYRAPFLNWKILLSVLCQLEKGLQMRVWLCLGYQCCAWSLPGGWWWTLSMGLELLDLPLCPLELGFHSRADARLLWVHGQNWGKWNLMTSDQPRPAEACALPLAERRGWRWHRSTFAAMTPELVVWESLAWGMRWAAQAPQLQDCCDLQSSDNIDLLLVQQYSVRSHCWAEGWFCLFCLLFKSALLWLAAGCAVWGDVLALPSPRSAHLCLVGTRKLLEVVQRSWVREPAAMERSSAAAWQARNQIPVCAALPLSITLLKSCK